MCSGLETRKKRQKHLVSFALNVPTDLFPSKGEIMGSKQPATPVFVSPATDFSALKHLFWYEHQLLYLGQRKVRKMCPCMCTCLLNIYIDVLSERFINQNL